MLYALADYSEKIRRTHVESALAVWQYAEDSARYIFGDLIGDVDADKVIAVLRSTEGGLTRTEISDLFSRNKNSQELDRIQTTLLNANRIRVSYTKEEGTKKPTERWHAA
jgi:hypothetical protein